MSTEECNMCQEQIGQETHHIILRKECKPLESCEINKVRLCNKCHNYLHHDRRGYIKIRELKMKFQNKLEMIFDRNYFTREEIKHALEIKDKPLDRLLKPLVLKKGMYEREDIIRACMGGKILLEE